MSLKVERGTKRTCQNTDCDARFYDLRRKTIVCPICSAPFTIAEPDIVVVRRAFNRSPFPFAKSPVAVATAIEPALASAEVESLEDGAAEPVIDDSDEKLLEQDEDADPVDETHAAL
jgi:hypothetical protein